MRVKLFLPVLLALAGCQNGGRYAVTAFESRPWPLKYHCGWILESTHYRIFTTVKDSDFHAAAVKLAEGQYLRFSQAVKIRPREKMTVYIFADVNQWIAFTEAKFGARAQDYLRIRNGGYTAEKLAVFYYLGRYPTLTILAHELFHLYVNLAACPEPVPAWINEGMATYYEAHEWEGCTPVFTPTQNLFRRGNLSDALCQKKLFPLKQLLETHAGEISKLPQPRVLTYYAQLWGLVRYLDDPKSPYHQNFQKLLCDLGTREMYLKARGYLVTTRVDEKMSFGEAVFRAYISEDLARFEESFCNYLPTLAGW
jgi:hypothetical protein